jgi:hypothetical protein
MVGMVGVVAMGMEVIKQEEVEEERDNLLVRLLILVRRECLDRDRYEMM